MQSFEFSDDRPKDYLEVIGFLSFGLIHQYTNFLTRIRLLAEFGSDEEVSACREKAREITGYVDGAWSGKLSQIWFTRQTADLNEKVTLDTLALGNLCAILQSSCRHFSSSYLYSIDEHIFMTGSFSDLSTCMVLPAARFCTALPAGNPPRPCRMSVEHYRQKKFIRVEHRFPAGAGVVEMIRRELESLEDNRIQWSSRCRGREETLFFLLPAD